MAFKKIFIFLITFLLLFSELPVAGELIGILPFSNQRIGQENDWLGFYIQARIETNLRGGSNWNFHNLSTLRLWKHKTNMSQPVSPHHSILIIGSFQQVMNLGYINVRVQRIQGLAASAEKAFEVYFTRDNLEEKLDILSTEIGQWIEPGFKLNEKKGFPSHKETGVREILEYRQLLFKPAVIPEISLTRQLRDIMSGDAPGEFIADLAEGLIIISLEIGGNEGNSILKESESLLRIATRTHIDCSRLFSLLAENYYFSKKPLSWVRKTAKQSIEFDSQNDLGYLLLALARDSSSDTPANTDNELDKVNPWIWPEKTTDAVQFQKGVMKMELFGLSAVKP